MTTYVPELNEKDKKDKVTLTVDREAYDFLKNADDNFCFDLAKLRAVAVFGCNIQDRFQGSNSADYFDDPDTRQELVDMFYALTEGFGVVSDYVKILQRSAESVDRFCCSAREVK